MAVIHILVEGQLDEAVAVRLIAYTGHEFGVSYGKQGVGYIKNKIGAFNAASKGAIYLALVDLMDTSYPCPSEAMANWLPQRQPNMIFRFVIREIESWLLADRAALASFLSVDPKAMPDDVERLPDPKRTLINIARKSRSRNIKTSLVTSANSTAQEGIFYTSELIRFVQQELDVERACSNAVSLQRCVAKLTGIVEN